MTDNEALIAEAREMASSSAIGHWERAMIDRLADALQAATVAPAVDREALVEWFKWHADPNDVADALIASGILRDVRDVQAEALEQAAGNFPFPQDPYGGFHHESLRAAFVQGTNWLRDRAQAIREARNEH